MFDTIKVGIKVTLSRQEIDLIQWTQTNSSCNSKKNSSKTIFKKIHDSSKKGSPFIRYTYKEDDPNSYWLKVEVSIPTFLYGSNVYELKNKDIPKFFKKLRKYIAEQLQLQVVRIPDAHGWTVEKLHVCKNFQVGSNVEHYLKVMSNATISKYKINLYCAKGSNTVETVEWKASKRKEKLYNKEAEVQQGKDYPNKDIHQKVSSGILRYEIELSDDEIRMLCPKRSAIEVVKIDNAIKILQRGLNRNGLSDGIKYTSLMEVINRINNTPSLKISMKEALVSFATEIHLFGVTTCRAKYAESTFRKRRKLLRTTIGTKELLIGDVKLPSLNVAKIQKKIVPVLVEQRTIIGNKS